MYGIVYKKLSRRRIHVTILLFIFLLISCTLNLYSGSIRLSINEILDGLFSKDYILREIIWEFRIPWVLMSIFVGASLAISGLQMQNILNNPLASPYTLGISSAAGFGAALSYVFGEKYIKGLSTDILVTITSFIFAFTSCLLILSIGKIKGFSSETLILGGIAISFMFQSLLALVEYHASEEALQAITFWLFGSLSKSSVEKASIVMFVLILCTIYLFKNSWKIIMLRMGEDVAKSVGINPEVLRIKLLIIVSILTSVSISFVGIIGFIGLVSPHIARMLLGEDQRFLIISSAIVGALLLNISAILSKEILKGALIPINIITSLFGVPFFLYLIIKGRRGYW